MLALAVVAKVARLVILLALLALLTLAVGAEVEVRILLVMHPTIQLDLKMVEMVVLE